MKQKIAKRGGRSCKLAMIACLAFACLPCTVAAARDSGIGAGFQHAPAAQRGALVTYIHTWRSFSKLHPGVDFVLSTFESWRRSVGHYPGRKFDLVAVVTELVAEKLQQHATIGYICQVQKLSRAFHADTGRPAHGGNSQVQPHSQCWLLTHTSAQAREWEGFPLVHDILHVASDSFKHFIDEMSYDSLVVVPNGAIVTPLLPTFTPELLSFSHGSYSWHPDTRHKLQDAASHLNISHSGHHGIGDVWAGPAQTIINLSRRSLDLLNQLLLRTFRHDRDQDTSLSEWMEDIDWEDVVDPSSSAGLQPWNVGHVVQYAAELAVHGLACNWTWDQRLGPSTGALQFGTMNDAAVIPPATVNGAFDLHQLLRNTHAYCTAWASGGKGRPGSLLHFAGLIACQGSETDAPSGELRYAESVQAPAAQ